VEPRTESGSRPVGIRVLEAQPELAEGLEGEQAELARRHVVAVLESIEAGPWDPLATFAGKDGMLGLLVIDGLLARDLSVAGRACSELLGPGDLLRPWDHADVAGDSVESAWAWTVIQPTRIAVLDERFTKVACRWPQLVSALVGRTLRRSRWMAKMLAISNLTRVDERIVALMWHLADRWGHVTPEGVVVPVPLTHEMIGRLVGAHRPSVTSALGDLHRAGTLERRDEQGWILHGEPTRVRRAALAFDPGLVSVLPVLATGPFV
jgi:CRP-like cAMP-binding protein